MTSPPPEFFAYLEKVSATAREQGLEVRRCDAPPYGWDLIDPATDVVVRSGPLSSLEETLRLRALRSDLGIGTDGFEDRTL